MASDDDYSGSEADTAVIETSIFEESSDRADRARRRSEGSSEAHNPSSNETIRMPESVRQCKAMLNSIAKRLKGHDIDENISLRVIRCDLTIRMDYLRAVQKNKAYAVRPDIRGQVCKLLGVHTKTYGHIIHTYLQDKSNGKRLAYASGDGQGRGGNKNQKETLFPRTKALNILTQNFMSKISRLERPLPKEEGTVLQQQSKDQTPGLLEMLKRHRWLALYQILCGFSLPKRKEGIRETTTKSFMETTL